MPRGHPPLLYARKYTEAANIPVSAVGVRMSRGTPGRFERRGLSGGGGRLTVAMHHAQHDGRDHAHGEWDGEVVDDVGILLSLVVCDHGQRVVLPGIVTRERGAWHTVRPGKVGAGHGRWVTAALDVDQKHGFGHDNRVAAATSATAATTTAETTAANATPATATGATGRTGRPVRDVYVTAVVHVAGAALPARAPCAVVQAGQLFSAYRGALHRFRHEVGQQCGHGRVHVQGH